MYDSGFAIIDGYYQIWTACLQLLNFIGEHILYTGITPANHIAILREGDDGGARICRPQLCDIPMHVNVYQ